MSLGEVSSVDKSLDVLGRVTLLGKMSFVEMVSFG